MKKRAISLIAAFALGVAALAAAPPAMAESAGVSKVAFGDSEASGAGNLLYVDRDCKRSRFSYPLILGMASYACTSATTEDVAAQIDDAIDDGKLGTSTKLVTITAGVNDLAWQETLLTCYQDPNPTQPGGPCQIALGIAFSQLPTVKSGIENAVAKVKGEAENATVLVTGYPLLFGNEGSSCSIGSLGGTTITVSPTVKQLANTAVGLLNDSIVAATVATGAEYVDVADAFEGHSLCDTRTPWIRGVFGLAQPYDGSLHINVAGQYALAAAVWRQR